MAFLKNVTIIAVVAVSLYFVDGARVRGKTSRAVAKDDTAAAAPVSIPGGFVKLAHKVSSGEVIIKDTRTIQIKAFSYDGAGPDAYFWIGKGTGIYHYIEIYFAATVFLNVNCF